MPANNSANGSLALASGEVTQLANIGATTISAADWTATAALAGTNTGDQTITLTGNVTGSGTGSFAATIAPNAVTYARIQDVSATDRFLGRDTIGAGVVEEITAAAARTILNVENGSTADQTAGQIESIVDHDNLIGFVGNEHIDHSSVSVTAGTGLNGGGTIAATRTINADVTSETQQGIVERATQAEVDTGTDTTRYISPATLAGMFSAVETKLKTADETVNNSNSLQDDDHLAGFTLETSAVYKVEGLLVITSADAADWRANLSFTNTPQDYWIGASASKVDGTHSADAAGPGTADIFIDTATSVENVIDITGFIRANATTGGTVDLQWAQINAAVSDTDALQGSWMTLTKIP